MKYTKLFLITAFLSFLLLATSNVSGEEDNIGLTLLGTETAGATYGVKSVIISPDGSRVYSMNLEGMSVYEFDRKSRKVLRKLSFIPTKGKGFDYDKKVAIDSFEEKPVEAAITHNGRYLWISLHNAGGVAVWDVKNGETYREGKPYKTVKIHDPASAGDKSDAGETRLLFIKTGKTPKVITASPDGKYIFVSNWHSDNVSVIKADSDNPAEWRKIKDIYVGTIPRGLAVSPDSRKLYVAQTGGSAIGIIDIADMTRTGEIDAGINPRHVITDGRYLYVTLNSESRLVKIDLKARRIDAQVQTGNSPRTVVLSHDGKYLFLVCYLSNTMQAFSASDLKLLGEWESSEHPVGLDIYEADGVTELWSCNYLNGTIRIFDFKTP